MAALNVNVLPKSATKEEALEVLLTLCDDDFNGNNGEEYISDEALESGYKSDAECYFNQKLKAGFSLINALEETLTFQYRNDSYYDDYEVEVLEHTDCYFIATTYVSQ